MQEEIAVVGDDVSSFRLDRALVILFPQLTRSCAQHLIEGGGVFVNGAPQKKRYLVGRGDRIVVRITAPEPSTIIPEKMDFIILYEDEDFFVINKPPHLVVHPAPGNRTGTFVNGLISHIESCVFDDPIRPGVVHRLDKDTSGVLLAAKNREALYAVSKQFHDRQVKKEYFAIVAGECARYIAVTDPIGRDVTNRKRMAISAQGKSAYTEVWPIGSSSGCSFVRACPLTGRTHQIRVHLRSIGLSILGDELYGRKEVNAQWPVRQMLHCGSLQFMHPKKQTMLCIRAPFFNDMTEVLQKLQIKGNHGEYCTS